MNSLMGAFGGGGAGAGAAGAGAAGAGAGSSLLQGAIASSLASPKTALSSAPKFGGGGPAGPGSVGPGEIEGALKRQERIDNLEKAVGGGAQPFDLGQLVKGMIARGGARGGNSAPQLSGFGSAGGGQVPLGMRSSVPLPPPPTSGGNNMLEFLRSVQSMGRR